MHEIGGILNWKISNFRSVGSGVNEQEVELAPLQLYVEKTHLEKPLCTLFY